MLCLSTTMKPVLCCLSLLPLSLCLSCRFITDSMTDETKRILLTGASGYLGQHILKELVTTAGVTGLDLGASKLHVYALYGSNKEFPNAVKSLVENEKNDDKVTVTTECLDLTNGDAVKAWLDDNLSSPLHVCIHTAALSSPRVCQKDPTHAAAINIPQTLFDKLAAQGCRIIALSTDQVYQGTKKKELYVETDPAEPVNVYGTTKLQMEKALIERHNAAVLLRASIILGPKAPLAAAHDTFLHFCASREGQPTDFYTDECRSVVFVQDVVYTVVWFARQLLLLSSSPTFTNLLGVYNMGGPDSVSRVDMAQAVFQHLGYDGAGSIVAKEKAKLPVGDVPSPLDIGMDSSKLESLMQRKFVGLSEILPAVFPR